MANQPALVFISYSHKDEIFLQQLLGHLRPLKRSLQVSPWSDKQIQPGAKWFEEIKTTLTAARVAVLLVTKDFLASDFVDEHELGPLLKSAEQGGVRILWALVRACSWEETPLKDYQALISPSKPLAEMKAERDRAWVKICKEIKKAVSASDLGKEAAVEVVSTFECYDVVAEFSIDSNPAGSWSYGYSRSRGGPFTLHTHRQPDLYPGVDSWASPQVALTVGVMHNRTAKTVTGKERTYTIPPDMLHLHPGDGSIYSVVRWTCPRKGRYSIQGLFSGLDTQTDTADTDVHILVNSTTPLFPSIPILRGIPTQAPIAFNDIRLNSGDTLDFMVGVGPSGFYGSDSTGLKATISLHS